jgi:hypothetical protein
VLTAVDASPLARPNNGDRHHKAGVWCSSKNSAEAKSTAGRHYETLLNSSASSKPRSRATGLGDSERAAHLDGTSAQRNLPADVRRQVINCDCNHCCFIWCS